MRARRFGRLTQARVGVVTVRIPAALRQFSDGQAVITLETADNPTVSAVLELLAAQCPGVIDRVLDEQGAIRRHVHVYVGDEDTRVMGGLTAPVPDGAEVSILPAVSGGTEGPTKVFRRGVRLLRPRRRASS